LFALTSTVFSEQRQRWQQTNAFHESDVYATARNAVWKIKTPDAVVSGVAPLCEALFDQTLKHGDRSLQVAYWIDKLTIALVKLKQFEEARRWIQRYDDLPAAVKYRDTGSVLQSLKKRKARCDASLSSDASEHA
jgi:hypothetical protein